MKKYIFVFLSLIAFQLDAQIPNLEWVKRIGGNDFDRGDEIHIDDNGDIITIGTFSNVVDFDPGPDEFLLTSIGEFDFFILKTDSNGEFIWAKNIGGVGFAIGTSINTDIDHNIFITGYFKEYVDFDPGPDELVFNAIINENIFILKLTPEGDLLWANHITGNSVGDRATSAEMDSIGNLYVTGFFSGTADFDSGPDEFNLSSSQSFDSFLLKLDSNGDLIWVNSYGTTGTNFSRALVLDSKLNVYISGGFRDTFTYIINNENQYFVSEGDEDAFLLKVDENGETLFGKSVGGYAETSGFSLGIDPSDNLIFSGYFKGNIDLNPDTIVELSDPAWAIDMFIIKLDEFGNYLWSKHIGGSGWDFVFSIESDVDGNLFLAGAFESKVEFDPGNDIYTMESNGRYDIFIEKLDPNGKLLWLSQLGGTGLDYFPSLILDENSDILVTGFFEETVDFDPSAVSENSILTNGGMDMFILKLSEIVTSSDEIKSSKDITVYPNPASSFLHVDAPLDANILTTLYARDGSKIISTNSRRLEVAQIAEGLYFLEIENQDTDIKITRQIIISN